MSDANAVLNLSYVLRSRVHHMNTSWLHCLTDFAISHYTIKIIREILDSIQICIGTSFPYYLPLKPFPTFPFNFTTYFLINVHDCSRPFQVLHHSFSLSFPKKSSRFPLSFNFFAAASLVYTRFYLRYIIPATFSTIF